MAEAAQQSFGANVEFHKSITPEVRARLDELLSYLPEGSDLNLKRIMLRDRVTVYGREGGFGGKFIESERIMQLTKRFASSDFFHEAGHALHPDWTEAEVTAFDNKMEKAFRKGTNPGRVRFDRASIDSAIAAAKRLQSEKDLYIFATYLGYTIDKRPPPGMQQYVIVHPDSSTETVAPRMEKEGNPMRTEAQRQSFHERIFGKDSTSPLERLGRGQTAKDLLPTEPGQGPPLPRALGVRWPWRR